MCNTISHTPPPETGTSPNFGKELYGRDIKSKCNINTLHLLVGATGFEPATTWSQTQKMRSDNGMCNKISHSPVGNRGSPAKVGEELYSRDIKKQVQHKYVTLACRGDRIRTCDHLVPNQVRYRTALHPVNQSLFLLYNIQLLKDGNHNIKSAVNLLFCMSSHQ